MEPLTVPGTLESLSAIRAYVMDASANAGLDKRSAYRLSLAVDEIATNVVVHGYMEGNREGSLTISAVIDNSFLKLALEDTAPSYDPRATPPPGSLDMPLEDRDIGGLGVFLALRGVDQFGYEHVPGRNRTIFIMNRVTQSG
jgi:serine/threonine-protein kinase RsbW